jgi:hypothetical protein
MKKLGFGMLVVFLSNVLSLCPNTWAQGGISSAKKWEYRIENKCSPAHELLNQLGQEGWELVAVASYGNEGGCQSYTFKRPRPKNAPIIVPAKPTPTPTPAPACTMTLEQSPTVHGLHLGLTATELLAMLPESKRWIEDVLKQPLTRLGQALHRLQFSIQELKYADSDEQKALARQFAPARSISIDFYNGKVASFSVSYSSSSDLLQWSQEAWIQKLAESYGLPSLEYWRTPRGVQNTLTCAGFEITTSAYSGSGSFTLSDPEAFAKAKQWLADEDARLQREFKLR